MKKNVLVGVCGGIAIYKVLDLISMMRKQDIEVTVVMTKNAQKFIAPLTFQTISQNKVHTDMFEVASEWEVEHIELAKKADLVLVVPATANIIGKVAAGIADDMLSTVIMATKAPVLFAPAMNSNMYESPGFRANVQKLTAFGYKFLEAAEGNLACGDVGAGKLPPIANIFDFVMARLETLGAANQKQQDLLGKHILVTAGPTVEPIDPVRFITNRSSGKMGFAIAEEAFARGAEVTLVAGQVHLTASAGIKRIDVLSTRDMLDAVHAHFDKADAVIKAAAPADYRPAQVSDQKIKKKEGELSLSFVRNPDILKSLGEKKGNKVLVGFAAETNDLESYAKEKIKTKNLDFIVANNVAEEGAGFGHNTNIITIIDKDGVKETHDIMTKSEVASVILDKLKNYL